jgi:hypothetical protein
MQLGPVSWLATGSGAFPPDFKAVASPCRRTSLTVAGQQRIFTAFPCILLFCSRVAGDESYR